eukprot:6097741-Pyramimonas_sp.AAC.1
MLSALSARVDINPNVWRWGCVRYADVLLQGEQREKLALSLVNSSTDQSLAMERMGTLEVHAHGAEEGPWVQDGRSEGA